jgi:putative transposase
VSIVDTSLVSRQAHERTHPDGHSRESESLGMGLQVSRGVHSECRRKTLYGDWRQYLGEVFRRLAQQKESRIEEGHLLSDHVHMLIAIPPKYAVAQVVGFIKGKSAIHLARVYGERKRNFVGQHFWARGYFVSTVGRDESLIREYIRKQEQEDACLDQLGLWR